jgi:hypothetical protein
LIANALWVSCPEEAKKEAGFKYARLQANGDVARATLCREFLQLVGGLPYLPQDALTLEVNNALDVLLRIHNGWNNFSNEPPYARILSSLIPPNGQVPSPVLPKYVKVLTMCRIGNGYGISWEGQPIYDGLIAGWGDAEIGRFISCAVLPDVASRMDLRACAANYQGLAQSLLAQATSPLIQRALQFIVAFPTISLGNMRNDARFKQILTELRTAGLL